MWGFVGLMEVSWCLSKRESNHKKGKRDRRLACGEIHRPRCAQSWLFSPLLIESGTDLSGRDSICVHESRGSDFCPSVGKCLFAFKVDHFPSNLSLTDFS